jgi:PAS domain S-box-containing protein
MSRRISRENDGTPSHPGGNRSQPINRSLLESYEFNQTLLQGAPYALSVTGLDTSIQYVNPAFERLTGFAGDELIGRKCPYPWWPAEKIEEYSLANVPGRKKKLNRLERCYQKKNGEVFWVVINIAPVKGKRGDRYFIGNYVDITERRRAEQEAERLRQIMTHLSRANELGEVATSMAHELNQPLTAIMSNARAALHMLESGNVDIRETRVILEDIYSDGQRAGDIIRRIRDPLRRGTPTQESLDVNSLIREIYRLLQKKAALVGVTIDLKLDPGLSPVRGDRTQILQVILNLMVNAIDSLQGLRDRRLWIEMRSSIHNDKFIRVEINDSGPGIHEAVRKHLFEPFFSTKPDGLGLGLSICQNLIESHGGQIWQENRAEGGSRFIFTLPVNQKS